MEDMKGMIVIAVIVSVSYMASLNLVMGQLKDMADFYGNMDYYVSQSLDPNQKEPLKPQPLESIAQPLKFGN